MELSSSPVPVVAVEQLCPDLTPNRTLSLSFIMTA